MAGHNHGLVMGFKNNCDWLITTGSLMQVVAGALFTHDHAGRMLRVNEPDGDLAPRFFLGRTCKGHVWRFRQDVPEAVVREMNVLCKREPVLTDVESLRQPPMFFEAI